MKMILSLALTATAGAATAAELALPPGAAPLKLIRVVGQQPSDSRFPARGILNQHFKGGLAVTLGGVRKLASLHRNRTGDYHLILIEEGGNVHEGQAIPLSVFRKGVYWDIDGKKYALSFVFGAQGPELTISPADGSAAVTLGMQDLREALFTAAAPVDSLGPEWRLVYQHDVWDAATMATIVFIEKTPHGLYFYPIRTEGMDWEREVTRAVGNRFVGLRFDEENNIVVRPVPPPQPPPAPEA